jgi:hypothetical protein
MSNPSLCGYGSSYSSKQANGTLGIKIDISHSRSDEKERSRLLGPLVGPMVPEVRSTSIRTGVNHANMSGVLGARTGEAVSGPVPRAVPPINV